MPVKRKNVTDRDLVRGLGTTMLARLGAVVDLLAQPIYIHLFGLTTYGLYAALWAAINLVENVADLGVTSSLQRTVPQAEDEREAATALRAAMVIGLTPCLLIGMLISIFAPHFAHIFNAPPADQDELVLAIRLFAWALPLWAFVEIATSALRARHVFGAEIRLRTMWEQIARLILAVLFYLVSPSIVSLLLAHLLSLLIVSFLCARLLCRTFAPHHFLARSPANQAKETLSVGLSTLPAAIVARLFSDGPPLLLNALIPGSGGAAAAGLYAVSRKFASVVFMIRTASGYVLSPLASSAHRSRENLISLYSFVSRLMVALALPLGCVMIGGSSILIELLGNQAMAAQVPLIILVAARTAEAIVGPAASVLFVIGNHRQRLLGSVVGLLSSAVLFLVLGRPGATEAAIAVGTGIVIAAAVSFAQLWRQDIHPFDARLRRTISRASAIGALVGAIALAAAHLPTVLQTAIFLIVAPAGLWLSARFALLEEDRRTLGKTGRRLRLIA